MPDVELLRKYAEVAVGIGLGDEVGDRVVISALIQLPDFTRLLGPPGEGPA